MRKCGFLGRKFYTPRLPFRTSWVSLHFRPFLAYCSRYCAKLLCFLLQTRAFLHRSVDFARNGGFCWNIQLENLLGPVILLAGHLTAVHDNGEVVWPRKHSISSFKMCMYIYIYIKVS